MDKPLDDRTVLRRRVKRWTTATASTILVIAAFALLPGWLRPSVAKSRLRIGRVELGTVEATLDAAGVVVPASERSIVAPFESRVLRVLKRAGDTVRAGDPIVELDTGSARLDLSRLEDRVAAQANEKNRLTLTLDRELLDLRARAESRRLDVEVLSHRAAQREKLRKDGLISDETRAIEAHLPDCKRCTRELRARGMEIRTQTTLEELTATTSASSIM